jgi:hypothetical protein
MIVARNDVRSYQKKKQNIAEQYALRFQTGHKVPL